MSVAAPSLDELSQRSGFHSEASSPQTYQWKKTQISRFVIELKLQRIDTDLLVMIRSENGDDDVRVRQ